MSFCDQLESLFYSAITRFSGDKVVSNFLNNNVLDTPDLGVVAIGKAAQAMAYGAQQCLGQRIKCGLVITAPDYTDNRWTLCEPFNLIFGNHPVPDQNSLVAGQSLVDFLSENRSIRHWLFLISGGTSSLVEVLRDNLTLEDLARANKWLLSNSWPIAEINCVRRSLSQIKGGGLLTFIDAEKITALYISDVPNDNLETIGSGLLVEASTTVKLKMSMPVWLIELIRGREVRRAKAMAVKHHIVSTLNELMIEVKRIASENFAKVVVDARRIEGEAYSIGVQLRSFLETADPGLYIWGGEPVVNLPSRPGLGGRAQVVAAGFLDGLDDQTIKLLVAGTDGRDGVSDFAGVCVDLTTKQQMENLKMELEPFLKAANISKLFSITGGGLPAFASGTNVADLFLGLKTQHS